MRPVYIFGHKSPDTDTVCSTIAYSDYKTKKGFFVKGMRLGELNNETKFILKYFDVEEPELLETIKTQVSDLEIDKPITIHPEVTLKEAWTIMRKNNRKVLTICEDEGPLLGLVTLSNITETYMDLLDENLIQKSKTPLKNILETLDAHIICGETNGFSPNGRVLVAALEHEKLKDYIKNGDIIIAGNSEDRIIEAIRNGANMVITTCGFIPGKNVNEIAKEYNCIILSTPNDTFNTARMIHQSVPVRYIMTKENIVSVNIDDFIDDVQEKMLKTRFRSYPVVDEKYKVLGMVSRYHLISRKRKKAILLDHNEKSQTVAGIDEAQVVEIIDHHRLGDIQTMAPIFMKNEPVGSTATIISKMYLNEKDLLTPKIAGLLLSAIISDTLKFMSPTSTKEDVEIAKILSKIANIDIEDFSLKLFSAGSNLKGKTVDEIINGDLKEYHIGRCKIGMSQTYSMNSESIADIKDMLMEKMEYYCMKNGYSLLMLLITDLYRNGSELIFTGNRKDLVYKAFPLTSNSDYAFLPGVLSRKKQVVPLILALENERY